MNYQNFEDSSDEFVPEKSIREDLRNIDVSENVKIKANEIYNRLQCSTKRGKRRKLLLFYCLYNAYNEFYIPIDPKILALKIGIKSGDITKSLSMFSELNTGYKPQTMRITALEIIPEYCRIFNFEEDSISNVLDITKEILNKNPNLNNKKPQNVAAGIIVYFSIINGISFSKKELSKMLNLSEVTINSMYKEVSNIHNQ